MTNQPTKQEFHTFFDVVNHLANHENNTFLQSGMSIFPGLPRPIPEVVKVMGWIHSIITAPEPDLEQEVSVTGFEINPTAPVGRKKPGPKPKRKAPLGPQPSASAGLVAASDVPLAKSPQLGFRRDAAGEVILPEKTPTPDELPETELKPGSEFSYADEVKGTVLIIPDDPTIMSNPEGFTKVPANT
jgi:hypothetical protein